MLTVLLVCPLAYAQRPRPDRLYRGLFGGNGADPNSPQQFDMNVSLFAGYDDNVLADPQSVLDPRFQLSGSYSAAAISLDYTRRSRRTVFDVTGGTTYRYYPSTSEMTGFNWFGSVGFTAELSSRTDLRATESASYSPFYSFGPFPDLAPASPGSVAPISPDYPLIEQAAISYYSAALIEHRLTPRSSLTADYSWSSVNYTQEDVVYRNLAAGGKYGYRLTSDATARIGYHYRQGVSSLYYSGQPIIGHDIDAGIDYSRALSLSRRTTVRFSVGSSIYRSFAQGADSNGPWVYTTNYLVTGDAYINRQIGRSWNARLAYRRGAQYVQGFTDPLFADSITASVGGFLAPRSRLNASASYSRGDVGIGIPNRGYDTSVGIVSYQFALARWGALFADYIFYHYVFVEGVPLPPGMNRGQDRQSVRGGVTLWLPLIR
jgi:hypothetical protein